MHHRSHRTYPIPITDITNTGNLYLHTAKEPFLLPLLASPVASLAVVGAAAAAAAAAAVIAAGIAAIAAPAAVAAAVAAVTVPAELALSWEFEHFAKGLPSSMHQNA